MAETNLTVREEIETLEALQAEYSELVAKAQAVIEQADLLADSIQNRAGTEFIKDGQVHLFRHEGYPVSVGYGNRWWLRRSREIPVVS